MIAAVKKERFNLNVRITKEEFEALHKAAEAELISLSAYARQSIFLDKPKLTVNNK